MRLTFLAICFVSSLLATPVWAWGESGHTLVTRVAVRLLADTTQAQVRDELGRPALSKELMLAHVANIPDILWRDLGPKIGALNSPTHYMDLDDVVATPSVAALPLTIGALDADVAKLCAEKPAGYVCPYGRNHDGSPAETGAAHSAAPLTGTAPFRAEQLWQDLVRDFRKAKAAKPESAAYRDAVFAALQAMGLLSHFIGDLAQPLHTTRDFDGFEHGAGGLHSYFESDVVSALPLSLDQTVYDLAKQGKTWDRLRRQLAKIDPKAEDSPLSVAYALAVDSYNRLPELLRLDETVSRLRTSREDHGMRIKAERRPAAATASAYAPFAAERLAAGAESLAQLWLAAWRAGGAPDLRPYHEFRYAMAPEFLLPDYLPKQPL